MTMWLSRSALVLALGSAVAAILLDWAAGWDGGIFAQAFRF